MLIFRHISFIFILFSSANGIAQQKGDYTCHKDSIFVIVDKMPAFPGGEMALRKYIHKHYKPPYVPVEEVNIGKIYVEFCINKRGYVERTKVIRSIHPLFDKEAIRVINSLPRWQPGKHQGKPVCVYYRIPIKTNWK